MLPLRKWNRQEYNYERAVELSKETKESLFLSKLLLVRGIDDVDKVNRYVDPTFIYDPFLLKDMGRAVDQIADAIDNGNRIVVYGDYDVDGMTATSILIDFFDTLGVNASYYIPNRMEEGYGLSINEIENAINSKDDLIITVDCGITAVEEIKYCVDNGINIIVTDHHNCVIDDNGDMVLPDGIAVVNPRRSDCDYPNKELCGAGVAFKLVSALCEKLNKGDIWKKYFELATIGTIADVMTLTDGNRNIVKTGLEMIKNTSFPAIKALCEVCDIDRRNLSSTTIAFSLAPKINAVGRMSVAEKAVELLIEKNYDVALQKAKEVLEYNTIRREVETKVYDEAVEIIEREKLDSCSIIVAYGYDWHVGIIGIVASKIAEKYARPAIVISVIDGVGKGSARSVNGINIYNSLSKSSFLLERFGGHEFAGGITIKEENIKEFISYINNIDVERPEEYTLIQNIDLLLETDDITVDNINSLKVMEPFGTGNLAPVFEIDNCKVILLSLVGGDKHLKMKVSYDGKMFDVIGFNMGKYINEISVDDYVNLVGYLEINEWKNYKNIQLRLVDMEKGE